MAAQFLIIPSLNEELLRNPHALRTILDTADIPINYCSADQKFLFVNKTYAAWYGLTPEDIIGKSLIDILGVEGNNTIRPYYERALKGEHFRYETEIKLSIGYRYLQCSYTPVFRDDGAVTGWVGIIYDMTQRYLLEKALRDNETALKMAKKKAEAANLAKSEFLTNMSHEIRTPMNAVIGLAHILSKSSPLTSKQMEMIDTLRLSAQSLLALINDLLDFEKLESNNIDLEYIPFRFSEIIDELLSMFSAEAEQKNIALIYLRHEEDDERFLGDPLRIRQILTNLIGNALKFTHAGSITVDTTTTPSSEPNHIYMHVAVRDTGIGIAPNKLNAVFDKFTQADMSITRQYGGSGLGLAISKNLAELMCGSITIKSMLGQGSEFTLHLPVEYENGSEDFVAGSAKTEELVPLTQKTFTVLVAEDHAPNILVITTLLDNLGYRYEVAHNGKEVLAKLQDKNGYDVVLMDVQMPELDGYTTTRIMREDEQKKGVRRLPVIALTAHVQKDNITKCFEAGMDDYIAKPFDLNTLSTKLNQLLKKGKSLNSQS